MRAIYFIFTLLRVDHEYLCVYLGATESNLKFENNQRKRQKSYWIANHLFHVGSEKDCTRSTILLYTLQLNTGCSQNMQRLLSLHVTISTAEIGSWNKEFDRAATDW